MAKSAGESDLIFSRGGLVALIGGQVYFIDKSVLDNFKLPQQFKKPQLDDFFSRLSQENLLVPAAMVGGQIHIFDSAGVPAQPRPPRGRAKASTKPTAKSAATPARKGRGKSAAK